MNGILLNKSDPDSVSPHKEHCKPLKQDVTSMYQTFKGFDPNAFKNSGYFKYSANNCGFGVVFTYPIAAYLRYFMLFFANHHGISVFCNVGWR